MISFCSIILIPFIEPVRNVIGPKRFDDFLLEIGIPLNSLTIILWFAIQIIIIFSTSFFIDRLSE